MRFAVRFFLFNSLVAWAFAAVSIVYNVTSGLEDYTLLVGRQMQNELDKGELQLATIKARHADRMESITNHQELILQEIQQFDNNLVQHQAFSISRKHCVQKHKPILPTFKAAAKNFTYCLTDAETSADGFTTNAEESLRSARIIREVDVPVVFDSCNRTYSGSDLENCITVDIDKKVAEFNKHMDQHKIRLRESLSISSVISTEATRCSFVVENKILTSNGAVWDLIDVCVEDLKKNGALTLATEKRNVIESKLMRRLLSERRLI